MTDRVGRRRTEPSPLGAIPPLVLVPAVIAVATLVVPLGALVARVEWSTFWADATSPAALQALGLSLVTGAIATVVCLVLGVPLALVIARATPRVAGWLRALVTIPLVLPPLVGGIALLFLLGRTSPIGQFLEAAFGLRLPFTTAAVVIAQTFVAMPFLVLSVEGTLRATGTDYERVASTLGASRWTAFRRVTVPLAAPGLVAGTVLSFARALGEFGATALFAGNAAGTTRTMPLAIYTAFNGAGVTQGAAVALSIVLLVVAIAILLLVRGWRPGSVG